MKRLFESTSVKTAKSGSSNDGSLSQPRTWLKEPQGPQSPGPTRLPAKEKFDIADFAIPAFALSTGAMVAVSAPYLIDASGFIGWFKVALLSSSAGLVSYIVNRFAIEYGADLTARGYASAGIASVGSIIVVGSGLFASTYAGLTIERVNALKLHEHGRALATYVERTNQAAAQALKTGPVVDTAKADFKLHVECESREGCLSKLGRGGRGPVTRALEPIALHASEISAQLSKGDATRALKLRQANRLVGEYQSTISNKDMTATTRRRKASRIDAAIKQEAGALLESMPLPLLRGYSAELNKGVTISGRPVATQNVNALLGRHGRSIRIALDEIEVKKIDSPAFPSQAGVSSTFSYIGHFLPIATLTAVIELVMPLCLWVYVLLSHLWRNFRNDPPTASAPVTNKSVLTNGAGHAG